MKALGQEELAGGHILSLTFDIQQQLSMAGAAAETVVERCAPAVDK